MRFYCRDFLEASFSCGRLRVDFVPAGEAQAGNFPWHVGAAVFDRMKVMEDALDWDRCLIMDHDQLALCDLGPYFDEDFEGNLLLGRMFGPGNTLGLQMRSRGGMPEELSHAEKLPYFYMGPMMNLTAMRKENTWQKLLAAHQALQQEEQMALTIATEGRVKGVGRKWNMVPQWDHLEEGPAGPERSSYGTVGAAARWKNGLPEGIIHWTGPAKPWHYKSTVWRADLWQSEDTSWEALRQGWWEKPLAVEILPPNESAVVGLAKRGWKVLVVSESKNGHKAKAPPYPDVHWKSPKQAGRCTPNWLAGAEIVRFGPGVDPLAWLESAEPLPQNIVLRGPAGRAAVSALRKRGYRHCVRLSPAGWPAGGPAPSVLEHIRMAQRTPDVPEGVELYLQRLERHGGRRHN